MNELKVEVSYHYDFCGKKTDFKIIDQQARKDLIGSYNLNSELTDLELMGLAEKASGYKCRTFYKRVKKEFVKKIGWVIVGFEQIPEYEQGITDLIDYVIFEF
jgi:hypothetical protein